MSEIAPHEFLKYLSGQRIIDPDLVEALARELPGLPSAKAIADELFSRGALTDYQRTQLLTGQGDKLMFGPYRLLEPLGEGGMGLVYKAWHSRLDRIVALKFIRPQYLASGPDVISRFHREARAIAQLHHPNIVMLYDADEIDSTPYIALEFIDGIALSEMVRKGGPLEICRACEYMRQAALGLQHAFERGLVHRDIKPSNLVVAQSQSRRSSTMIRRPSLVTIEDRARAVGSARHQGVGPQCETIKILDMGLARLKQSLAEDDADAMTALTQTGAMLGTPDFISPEQARSPRDADIRSDLYSLGCTFYSILTCEYPFPGGTGFEKLLRHQTDEPTPMRSLRPDVPAVIESIVQRLMAKRPEARYQSPQELADVLAEWLAKTKTVRDPVHRQTPPHANRHGKLSVSNAPGQPQAHDAELAATRISAEALDIRSPESSPIPRRTENSDLAIQALGVPKTTRVQDESPPAGSPHQPYARFQAHRSVVTALALSPDGRIAASGGVDGAIRIWDLDCQPPVDMASLVRPGEIQVVHFAPDHLQSLYFGEDSKNNAALRRWDWGDNQLADVGDVASLAQPSISCIAFDLEGTSLAAGVGPHAVWWKLKRQEATGRMLFKGAGAHVRALAIAPDQPLLAVASQDGALKFYETKKRFWSRSQGIDATARSPNVASLAFSPDGRWLAMVGLGSRITLWEMGSAQQSVVELTCPSSGLQHVQFAPDGKNLIAVGVNGEVCFCDVQAAKVLREVKLNLSLACRFAISANAHRFAAGYSNGDIAFFNLPFRF